MIVHKHALENMPEWQKFIKEFKLTPLQADQFARYLILLQEHNELFNLTAITDPAHIIAYHFQDSLALGKACDLSTMSMIADVGAGAGFPGIPLKIVHNHLDLFLIEVTKKKINFLNTVINELQLEQTLVWEVDWRTFLRKTDEPIDLFVSRASLHTDELIRMFKANCPYKDRRLVYWASQDWQPLKVEQPFVDHEMTYHIAHKLRRLIFFKSPNLP